MSVALIGRGFGRLRVKIVVSDRELGVGVDDPVRLSRLSPLGRELEKLDEHPAGRAPDGVAIDAEEVEPDVPALRVIALFALVVVEVDELVDGERDDLGHLAVVRHPRLVGRADDERPDRVPGNRRDIVQLADVRYRVGVHVDLLACLAEGGGIEVLVGRLASAAGKRHLAGVATEVVGLLDEEQILAAVALDDGHDDGRLPLFCHRRHGGVGGDRVEREVHIPWSCGRDISHPAGGRALHFRRGRDTPISREPELEAMTRVIHTGDTHLGYRQYHLPERRQDFLDAFRRVADDAVADEVDAVVHAGDLFHDRKPDLADLLGTIDVLRTLDDAAIPFLAVVGNHETTRDGQWLDLFESMGLVTRLDDSPTVVGDTAFYGLDFVPRAKRDDLDYQFESHDADHAALVSHGLFEPLVPDYGNVDWDAAEVLDAANVDFDAFLLGDEHTPERVEIDGCWVTYCGSTERASASEEDERGYNIVEFADGEAHISRRGIPTREFVFVTVDLGPGEGLDRVREQVAQHDLEDAVLIVSIDGEGDQIAPARVESFIAERGALTARVHDRREYAAESDDLEVSFADPDDAVEDRLREMELSEAARDIDETVRASKLADSNVADTVESRVSDLVDDGDLDALPGEATDGVSEQPADAATEEETPEQASDGQASMGEFQ